MHKFSITMAAILVGGLLACSTAEAKIVVVRVAKDSKLAAELGYTLAITPNGESSGLEGTLTFELTAPKNPLLEHLSRAILEVRENGPRVLEPAPSSFSSAQY